MFDIVVMKGLLGLLASRLYEKILFSMLYKLKAIAKTFTIKLKDVRQAYIHTLTDKNHPKIGMLL